MKMGFIYLALGAGGWIYLDKNPLPGPQGAIGLIACIALFWLASGRIVPSLLFGDGPRAGHGSPSGIFSIAAIGIGMLVMAYANWTKPDDMILMTAVGILSILIGVLKLINR